MRTAKTLIRLGGCQGWSESSLGAYAILLVLSCRGSHTCVVKSVRFIMRPDKGSKSGWRNFKLKVQFYTMVKNPGQKTWIDMLSKMLKLTVTIWLLLNGLTSVGPGDISGMNLVQVCRWASSYPPCKCILEYGKGIPICIYHQCPFKLSCIISTVKYWIVNWCLSESNNTPTNHSHAKPLSIPI